MAELPNSLPDLARILATVPVAIAVLRGRELRYEWVNAAHQALDPGRVLVGRTLAEAAPEAVDAIVPVAQRVLDDGIPFRAREMRIDIRRGGSRYAIETYFDVDVHPLPADASGAPGLLVTAVETTAEVAHREAGAAQRVRARMALEESEALYRAQFEEHAAAKLVIDPDTGDIVDANDAAATFYGWPRDVLRSMQIQEINTLSPEEVRAEMEAARRARRNYFEFRHRLSDGAIRDVAVFSSKFRARGRELLHSIVHDVSEQRRAEEARNRAEEERREAETALVASRASFAQLYEGLGDGIVSVRPDGSILEMNEAYCSMLGYTPDELRSMRYQDLTPERWHAEEARLVEEQIRARRPVAAYEKEYRRKDGSVFPVELRSFVEYDGDRPVRMWAIVRDITEAETLRRQLGTASRMAAMGTLVSGLAHEINNPLGAALAAIGYVAEETARYRESLAAGASLDPARISVALDRVQEALDDAQTGGRRIAGILRELALFGRPDPRQVRIDVVDAIHRARRWLPATLFEETRLVVEAGSAPDVLGSEGQFVQVVASLLSNAAQAIPRGRPGTVVVRSGTTPQGLAFVEVKDDGEGMAPDVVQHVFDPFFTTRKVGQGMGLGLAIAHAVVSSMGGTIDVESAPGRGATFRVELPPAPPAEPGPATGRAVGAAPPGGST